MAKPPRSLGVRDGAPNCHPQPQLRPLLRERSNENGGVRPGPPRAILGHSPSGLARSDSTGREALKPSLQFAERRRPKPAAPAKLSRLLNEHRPRGLVNAGGKVRPGVAPGPPYPHPQGERCPRASR
ncbi:hypothetical protein P7K49_010600 [Saguinus oedipus]|uniref:Uncharacterized protein n=1 Tax=Saguinus oedipus TaxID=9490 RepID=A0ABQ9VNA2_SAGOE|nr:hypothetical protein P7K49_010600 [Saguinus oedipus]